MKFTNKYTYSDLLELLQTRQRAFFTKSLIFWVAGVSILLFPIAFYKEIASGPGTLLERVAWVLPIVILGLGFFPPSNATLMAWLTLRHQRKLHPNGFECEITPESVDLFTHSGAHYLKWSTFLKGRESKTAICLFTETEGFIFQKRYFDSESLSKFKALISERTTIRL